MPEEIEMHKPATASDTDRGSQELHVAEPARKFPTKWVVIPLVVIVIAAACVYFFAPHKTDRVNGRQRLKTVPVTVSVAATQLVPIEIRTTGNIQPYSIVNVVPQVSGQLQKVYFKQGQHVKKGDLLFQIDPRSYQSSLGQAEGNVAKDAAQMRAAQANLQRDQANIGQLQANLAKDQASLRYANVEYDRYKKLAQQGAISMEQADQTLTSAATATAQIQADQMQIENARAVVDADRAGIDTAKATLVSDQAVAQNARLQLEWCTIRAPMDGRTGSLNVYEGNVVAANNAIALVSIAQIQPIYVSFTIPEDFLDQVRRALGNQTLSIQAMIEGVEADYLRGTASFLENTVNTTSGTALLRAEFANTDERLFPGQFVDVIVSIPPSGATTVVPAAAVQTTQQGSAVYVVQPDKTVALVPVKLERTVGDIAALSGGIKAGDVVVTDGQMQLQPGSEVRIVTADGKVIGGQSQEPGQGSGRHRRGGWGDQSAPNGGVQGHSGGFGGWKTGPSQATPPASPAPQSGATSPGATNSGTNGWNRQGLPAQNFNLGSSMSGAKPGRH